MVKSTNVWIIEWLAPGERRTGYELHEWMEIKRPGWSTYSPCQTGADVLAAIDRARLRAQQTGIIPILHLEAHGGNSGLAPSSNMNAELLAWEKLTIPLQGLNLATRCNLVVVVAACVGFAVGKALRQGPRAPAVALVGPDAKVAPSELLLGMKEFYRRLMADNPSLLEIASSASRELGSATLEWEPFVVMCYEATTEALVRSARPAERRKRREKFRKLLRTETDLLPSQVENRLGDPAVVCPWTECQVVWNQMFMIDIYPENEERFGVDMRLIVERIFKTSTG